MADEAPAPKPIEVNGITAADYAHWLRAPVTKWFMAYLADWRGDVLAAAQADWLAGNLQIATADEIKGRANTLLELTTLPFDAVAAFYQQVDQREQEANDGDDSGPA